GRCHCRRVQGDAAGALEALAPALATVAPLKHREWPLVAAAHVQVLTEIGRTAEAVQVGRDYLATCRDQELYPGALQVAQAVAAALLAAGEAEESACMVDELIEETRSLGVHGLSLGTLYELRARAALAHRDEAEFTRFSALCKEEYRPDSVP